MFFEIYTKKLYFINDFGYWFNNIFSQIFDDVWFITTNVVFIYSLISSRRKRTCARSIQNHDFLRTRSEGCEVLDYVDI